jgi:hypothetical protein
MQQDYRVLSIARALALANEAAIEAGSDLGNSIVTIPEELGQTGNHWRIHYGPRDYISRRGGDLTVLVDSRGKSVLKVLRGQ